MELRTDIAQEATEGFIFQLIEDPKSFKSNPNLCNEYDFKINFNSSVSDDRRKEITFNILKGLNG